MPRYRVIEFHTYTLTFEVEAPTRDAAKALVNTMDTDEADNEELGTDNVTVETLEE